MSADDQSLAYILDLDGEEIVYEGSHVARFKIKEIPADSGEAAWHLLRFDIPRG